MTEDLEAAWNSRLDSIVPMPISIIEFAESEEYCGIKLFPHQRIMLKIYSGEELDDWERSIVEYWRSEDFVPPDIWQRIERSIEYGGMREVLLVIGRRGSKSFVSAVIAAYEIYKLLLKENPHEFYNMLKNEPITIALIASSGKQASEVLFPKVRSIIINCKWLQQWIPKEGVQSSVIWFQTKNDRQLDQELRRQGKIIETKSIKVEVLASDSKSTRGRAAIIVIFDELAHFKNREGRDNAYLMYEAMTPSTKGFGVDGRIISISSPLYEFGQLFDIHENIWKGGRKNALGMRMPTWETYRNCELIGLPPRLTKKELMEDEEIEYGTPEWDREYAAKFQKNVSTYMNADHIERMFEMSDEYDWTWQAAGRHIFYSHGHGDPSKNHAGFPILLGHYDPDHDKVFVDFIWRWKVRAKPNELSEERETFYPPGSIIDYDDVENKIAKEIFDRFYVRSWSFDQWNSIGSIQRLQKHANAKGQRVRVHEWTFRGEPEYRAYEKLRNELSRQRVVCPKWLPLQRELNNVLDNGGKIVPPDVGPVTTKDIADCLAIVVTKCLEDADQKGRKHRDMEGNTLQQMGGQAYPMPSPTVVRSPFSTGSSPGFDNRRDPDRGGMRYR